MNDAHVQKRTDRGVGTSMGIISSRPRIPPGSGGAGRTCLLCGGQTVLRLVDSRGSDGADIRSIYGDNAGSRTRKVRLMRRRLIEPLKERLRNPHVTVLDRVSIGTGLSSTVGLLIWLVGHA